MRGNVGRAGDEVSWGDLQWDRQRIPATSSSGAVYYRFVPTGMPRIPDKILDTAFYLYPDSDSAKLGTGFGGTGFVVSVKSEKNPEVVTLYGVTNWHVAVREGCSVIRLNNSDGSVDIREHDPSDWLFDPQYDLAVIPLQPSEGMRVSQVRAEDLVALDDDIGIGDDVFMVGRFIDHDGVASNKPAIRFGNISIDPTPIVQPNKQVADCYCVDVHSRSGFSGSPVFVYNQTTGRFYPENEGRPNPRPLFLKLLGIHWGQFPEEWEIVDGKGRLIADGADGMDSQYIKGLSGMTCVLPAWRIMELLNHPELLEHRKMVENEIPDFNPNSIPVAESLSPTRSGSALKPNKVEDSTESTRDALLGRMLNTPPNPKK